MKRLVEAYGPGAPILLGATPKTIDDLLRDAAAIAAQISADGHWRREAWLSCHDRYHLLVATLAAWSQRHVVCLPPLGSSAPMHPRVPRSRAPRSRDALLLHDATPQERTCAGENQGTAVAVSAAMHAGSRVPIALISLPSQKPVLRLHTSGTMHAARHRDKTPTQLLAETDALIAAFALRKSDRFVATVSPQHIYGLLFSLLLPLRLGARFARQTPLFGETIALTVQHLEASVLVSVPAHLRGLQIVDPMSTPLRRVFSSGAPLRSEQAQDVARVFGLYPTDMLGSTETGGIAWRQQRKRWTPLPGVNIKTEDGLLVVTSPFTGLGALPLTTNERVDIGDDGCFLYLGRADAIVKVGGQRVCLAAMAEKARSLPGVRDAVAIAMPGKNKARENDICLAAVAPAWSPRSLKAALGRFYSASTLPKRIRLVDALPLSSHGKIDKQALDQLFTAPAPTAFATPVLPGTGAPIAVGETAWEVTIAVPQTAWCFAGHFPQLPLLPGVVQLTSIVAPQAQALWPDLGALRGAPRIKYVKAVRPGDTLKLLLERQALRTLRFCLSRRRNDGAGDDGAGDGGAWDEVSWGRVVFAPTPRPVRS